MAVLRAFFILYYCFLPLVSYAKTGDGQLNMELIEPLIGRCALRDGPNCFNAALMAKGFNFRASQASGVELKYFLAHHCVERKGPPAYGDVLTSFEGQSDVVAHAAVYLGQNKILEKYSYAGIRGAARDDASYGTFAELKFDSIYAVRPISDSGYFKPPATVRTFRCRPVAEVQTEQLRRFESADVQDILKAKKLFSGWAFDRQKSPLNRYRELLPLIQKITKTISHVGGNTPEDLFTYVNARSIALNTFNMRYEQNTKCEMFFDTEPELLEEELDALASRILQSNTDPRIHFILEQ